LLEPEHEHGTSSGFYRRTFVRPLSFHLRPSSPSSLPKQIRHDLSLLYRVNSFRRVLKRLVTILWRIYVASKVSVPPERKEPASIELALGLTGVNLLFADESNDCIISF